METDGDVIKAGDFVIAQRENYTKLHKLKPHGQLSLGSMIVEMDNVIGEKYHDTFQMKNFPNNKRLYFLEKIEEKAVAGISIEKSGSDNRHITDAGDSQGLTRDQIDQLKEEELNSNNIVGQLIANSKSFSEKTEYSQEKYIKKKTKKYYEYVQVRRPTIRLLANMFYRQDPAKTLGMRLEHLSQILTYANVQSEGTHLVYDSGTNGLMAAAILNALGKNTEAHLVHMHPGNECQKTAITAMHFPKEQLERCINVNMYSVLRCYHQNKNAPETSEDKETEEPVAKRAKLEEPDAKRVELEESEAKRDKPEDRDAVKEEPKKACWQKDNEKACKLLREKVESLIVVANSERENVNKLVLELSDFLKGGRSLAVFSTSLRLLEDLYVALKARIGFINVKILSSFVRNYQVLPNRTHPEVNMNSGGYILTAIKLESC